MVATSDKIGVRNFTMKAGKLLTRCPPLQLQAGLFQEICRLENRAKLETEVGANIPKLTRAVH